MKKSNLASGMRALNRCQQIKAACEARRVKLHTQFGEWVIKQCMGWASGALMPDYNWKKHSKRYTMVSVGFKCYLVDDQRVPKKYHSVLGIYKGQQRNHRFRFVPEVMPQKVTVGQTNAQALLSGVLCA